MGKTLITQAAVEEFKTIDPLLDSLYTEVKSFASKKQDGILSELKVKAINKILIRAKEIVKGQKGAEFLELLDDETLPSNSDAVIIIVQYQSLMFRYRKERSTSGTYGGYSWNLDEDEASFDVEENDKHDLSDNDE